MTEEKNVETVVRDESKVERPASQRGPRKPKLESMRVDNCARVNVRTEPSTDGEVITTIDRGTVVKVDPTRDTPDFSAVVLNGTKTGYVMKTYLVKV